MSERRRRRINELFARALELGPDARDRYVDAAGTTRTRDELNALLDAHATMDDFLAQSAPERFVPPAARPLEPGDRVGAYRVIRPLGEGGGGTVYEAEQKSPRRRVALKVGHVSLHAGAEERFREEAEILARLEHPSIAHVYEAGVFEGVPYFALEYVADARTIREHASGLDRRALLRLFAGVCGAVHHGHQRGIVHRDLKPRNILVDASGQPKIIDFGIARAVGADAGSAVAGTPAYMSPEQFAPDEPLDVRTDVYSLGLILYELLLGRRPYDVNGMPLDEARRVIEAALPVPRGTGLGRDLEAILAKALARRREDRYASAAALADDLLRYLEHRPVEARPATLAVQLARFARRQRFAFASVCVLVAVLAGAAAVATWLALEKEQQRKAAEAARARSDRQRYFTEVGAAASALEARDLRAARVHVERAPAAFRGWEWRHLRTRIESGDGSVAWPGARVRAAAIDAEGRRLARAGTITYVGSLIRVHDLVAGTHAEFTLPGLHGAESVAFLDGGSTIAVGRVLTGELALYEATTGRVRARLDGHEGHVTSIAVHPGGRRLASSSYDGTVRLWDVERGALLRTYRGHDGKVFCVAFDPSGELLASGGEDGTILIRDLEGGAGDRRIEAHEANVEAIRFGDAGRKLVSGGIDGHVCVFDVHSGERLADWSHHTNFVKSVDFHPDGRRVASGALDRTVRVFDVDTGRQVACHVGHSEGIYEVMYAADGSCLYSTGLDGTLRIWRDGSSGDVPELHGHTRSVARLAFTRDGARLVSVSSEGVARCWDVRRTAPAPAGELLVDAPPGTAVRIARVGEERVLALDHHGMPGSTVAVLPDGRLATAHADGTLRVEGRARPGRCGDGIKILAVSHSGRYLASWTQDGIVRIWSETTMREIGRFPGARGASALAVSDDRVAVATAGRVDLLDRRSGRRVATMSASCRCLAFSPDGTRLAGAGFETIQVWDAADGQTAVVLDAHPLYVISLAWSPDGAILASGGGDHFPHACTIRLWRAE